MNFGDPRLPDRFWVKVIPEPNSGCWLWFAAIAGGWEVRQPQSPSFRDPVTPISSPVYQAVEELRSIIGRRP
jgi:hypothetical protein